jgi:CCR4-NOT transcriptional regulation complex NOT5 subunit
MNETTAHESKDDMDKESSGSKSHQTVPAQQESKTIMNKTTALLEVEDDMDDEFSCSKSHQTVPGSSNEGDEDKEIKDRIIKKEEKAVRNARLLVITAIIACAVAVTTAIYIFASKNDETTFELEVSNNRNIHYCNFVIATIDALTVIPTPYLMTRPSV